MLKGALTGYVDVAQVALYAFWAFFAGLVYYLRREDRREGYPLVSEILGQTELAVSPGFPPLPPPKVFKLFHGGVSLAPQTEPARFPEGVARAAAWPGAPLAPIGNPLLDGVGPASWALRQTDPDLTIDGIEKFRPLRIVTDYRVDPRQPQPHGMRLTGADGIEVGTVVDVWIDEIAHEIVFLEVELDNVSVSPRILVPEPFLRYRPRLRQVNVRALLAHQFLDVPRTRDPDKFTRMEEERILAYFGGGLLYATPARLGPLL